MNLVMGFWVICFNLFWMKMDVGILINKKKMKLSGWDLYY